MCLPGTFQDLRGARTTCMVRATRYSCFPALPPAPPVYYTALSISDHPVSAHHDTLFYIILYRERPTIIEIYQKTHGVSRVMNGIASATGRDKRRDNGRSPVVPYGKMRVSGGV